MNKTIYESYNEDFWDLETQIYDWHIKTFPDATLESQLLKLNEEFKEYIESPSREECIKELADIYIVNQALSRWNCEIGEVLFNSLWLYYNEVKSNKAITPLEMYEAIANKMKINKQRVWKKNKDGVYHHEDKLND